MKNNKTRTFEALIVSELDQWFRRNFCELARTMISKDVDDPDEWADYTANPFLIGYPSKMEIWLKERPMPAAVYLTDTRALLEVSQQLPMAHSGRFITAMQDFTLYFNHLIPKYRITTSEHEVELKRISILLIFQTLRTLAVKLTFQLPLTPLEEM